jgi:thymidylate synthase (FAD)
MGSDEFIVESARMSTSKGFEGWEPHERCKKCGTTKDDAMANDTFVMSHCYVEGKAQSFHEFEQKAGDAKMLDFMYKNRHATPFEFGQLVIEVQAPIMVFREWHRHRTQSYSEMSARYVQMPDLHYLPAAERIQVQSKSNKQGGAESLPADEAQIILDDFANEQGLVYAHYNDLVGRGVAKEVARLDTPVSRYSRMRASADLRCWLAFLLLRRAPAAQWEIRQYADVVGQIVAAVWPRAYALFEEYDFFGTNLSRTEGKKLHKALMLIDSSVLKEIGLLDLVKRLESIP